MIKNNLKKVVALLLSMSCILTNVSALGVSAEEDANGISNVVILNEEDNGQPPMICDEFGIVPYDGKVPNQNAAVDLRYNSPFVAHISSFKHVIYTNVMFTGAGGMTLSITGSVIAEYLNGDHSRRLTLSLYKYNAKGDDPVVFTDTIWYGYSMDLIHCYPLDAYSKYYVKVEKTQDNIYLYNLDIHVTKSC